MNEYGWLYRTMTAEEIEADLRREIDLICKVRYACGNIPDPAILRRIEEEWQAVRRTESLLDIAALCELTSWLRRSGYPYHVEYDGGSSLLFWLLGITFGNPLPPHRYCADCGSIEWVPEYKDGFDIPQGTCIYCGGPAVGDGHDIESAMLFTHDGSFGIYISVTPQAYLSLQRAWQEHWMKDIVPNAEAEYGYDLYGARFINLGKLWLSFSAEHSVCAPRFSQQELAAENRTFLLDNSVCFLDEYADAERTLPLPTSVADLIALYGLSHSEGAWDETSEHMMRCMGYRPAELIAFRDDVYRYLVDHGLSEEDAERNMGMVDTIATDEMKTARDKWVLDRCRRIKLLRYKAEAVEYMCYWFKADLLYDPCYEPYDTEYEYLIARARFYGEM